VAPGRIETQRLQELDEINATASGRSIDEVRAASHAEIPLRRYGQPHELGDVITFLASERASYLSGITVLVDGGMLHGLLS
jgi:3-oxoacyl-[acyl-carrier protein] reductase